MYVYPVFSEGLVVKSSIVTSSILKNLTNLALGALLGVGVDPVGRLAIIGTLLQPQLQQPADDRLVPFVCARKTETHSARTDHRPRLAVRHLQAE